MHPVKILDDLFSHLPPLHVDFMFIQPNFLMTIFYISSKGENPLTKWMGALPD